MRSALIALAAGAVLLLPPAAQASNFQGTCTAGGASLSVNNPGGIRLSLHRLDEYPPYCTGTLDGAPLPHQPYYLTLAGDGLSFCALPWALAPADLYVDWFSHDEFSQGVVRFDGSRTITYVGALHGANRVDMKLTLDQPLTVAGCGPQADVAGSFVMTSR